MIKSSRFVKISGKVLLYLLLIIAAIVMVFPLYTGFLTSVLGPDTVSSYPPKLFPVEFRWQNYIDASQQAPLLRFILNSFIQSGGVMILQLLTASLAAFAFAFLPFKGKNIVFLIFLSTMMIPWESTIIPNYLFIQKIGWDDTYQGSDCTFCCHCLWYISFTSILHEYSKRSL